MKILLEHGLTFDDVLLSPQFNNIASRKDVRLTTRICKGGPEIEGPLLSANMDSVTESPMMIALSELGCAGIMHRFMTPMKAMLHITSCRSAGIPFVCASLGVNRDAEELLDRYNQLGVDVICIDVAHGHCTAVLRMIERVKSTGTAKVIAGNVATAEATQELIESGADAIKVGIGPGSLCTTRIVTGCGVPQLSAIAECYAVASEFDVPIIADGGMKSSGDVVKALAAGAETIMSGSFFSGTDETPGQICKVPVTGGNFKKMKKYQGMASHDAMTGWKGANYHAAPEGESKLTDYKGPVKDIVKPILAGIRSGMTYNGASTLGELREKAVFRRVSPNCLIENRPHGK